VCHQCSKAQPMEQAITLKCGECNTAYCTSCLWNRYGKKLIECLSEITWKCPCCMDSCNCIACLEKKGIQPGTEPCPISSDILEDSYPFRHASKPNIPCPSDFKPQFQNTWKKRKVFPYQSTIKTLEPSKMTERQQMMYILKMSTESTFIDTNNHTTTTDIKGNGNTSTSNHHPLEENHSTLEEQCDSTKNANKKYKSDNQTIEEYSQENDRIKSKMQAISNEDTWNDTNQNKESNPLEDRESTINRDQVESNSYKEPYYRDDVGGFLEPPIGNYYKGNMDPSSTIYVKNLSERCTKQDIEFFFRGFGPIDYIKLPLDWKTNRPKGFAFIKFRHKEDAKKAMARYLLLLNMDLVCNDVLKVELWNNSRENRRIILGQGQETKHLLQLQKRRPFCKGVPKFKSAV
jgi:hypothetical protein